LLIYAIIKSAYMYA